MDRLTKKNTSGTGYFYPACFEKCDGVVNKQKCEKCKNDAKYCERLGQYEDLGLTPEQIRKIDVMYRELAEKLAQYERLGIPPETVAEYKKFEDNLVNNNISFGRVLELIEEERCRKCI